MFPLGQRFFGLTLTSKIDLFLRDIQAIMKIYPGTSYWDAYLLPIPVRRWLIEEHIRQMEQQEPKSNTPLSHTEKKAILTNQVRSSQKNVKR